MTFVRTSFIISHYIVMHLGWLRGARIIAFSAWSILKVLLFYPDSKLSFKRNMACWKCDMYDSKWRTCGTPGEVYKDADGIVQRLGCWCVVDLANRLPSKRCWARSQGLMTGWTDDLLPKE